MPKTIRNVFDKHLNFEAFYQASLRVCKTKRNKVEVLRYNVDLETNIINLMDRIIDGKYKLGKYREFIVKEPKERIIKALPFQDRIVHQWYIHEFIKPYIIPRFISDTYACIDNRGTHKAVLKVQKYMRLMQKEYGSYYILKCDIKKYFYSINKNILFKILSKYIGDKKLLDFTKILIYDSNDEIGIPIGNYTSQYFANIYLNELDQYIKHKLKVKYYVRYMDDFVLLVKTKDDAKELLFKIEKFLTENLKLTLNSKSRYYPNAMGVNFCGYRIFETHRLLRKRSKDKIRKNINKWNKKYKENKLDITASITSFKAWLGHSNHCNSYNLQRKMYAKISFKDRMYIKNITNCL